MTKKRSSGKKATPKKGDPDYLSPTQLRNRRKRRAKKEQKQQISSDGTATTSSAHDVQAGKSKSSSHNTSNNKHYKDPSMKYILNPMKAPIVQAAKKYFQPILQKNNTKEFHVHLGPCSKWRTVSKLAVRPDSLSSTKHQPKVAIGLFLPQSHTLLPVPNCRAHHPSINLAVECITQVCNDLGVIPYQENGKEKSTITGEDKVLVVNREEGVDGSSSINNKVAKGTGQLRYIAINVARETGGVQITLVWNTPPPNTGKKRQEKVDLKRNRDGEPINDDDDDVLEKLVSKLISMSSASYDIDESSTVEDGKVGNATVANHDNCKSMNDGESTKKRRRRGRRDKHDGSNPDTNNSPATKREESSKKEITGKGTKGLKLNLHSLWINYNESWKHSNAIFSFDPSCWRHVHGPRAVVEHLSFGGNSSESQLANPTPPRFSIPLHFPPNVFRQANLDSFTNIVARIRERLADDNNNCNNSVNCIELYGGVGTIGLHVADTISSLVSSDENPNNAKCFYDSVRALPTDIQSRLVYRQKNAADMITSEQSLFERSQVLIVDPPRKGLDIEVVDYLCTKGYKTMKLVVYVSCGFQAFQRDCDALIKSGRWKVEFAEGYLLFPGSDAIETIAFFVPEQ